MHDGDERARNAAAGDTNRDKKLQATETWTYTCSHTVTAAELAAGGNLTNTVTVDSAESAPDSATLNIPIVPGANRPPVAVNDSYKTKKNILLTVAAPGVLTNDTDPDANPLTAILVTNVTSGTLVFNPNGSFTYMPATNVTGKFTFTYKANDGTADSNVVTVTIEIQK